MEKVLFYGEERDEEVSKNVFIKKRGIKVNNCIYYFTGTGNSYFVAKKLARYINGADLIPITAIMKKKDFNCDYDKVGIAFPLYYGGLPEIVLRFMKKINIKKDAYIFALCTRGASKGQAMAQIDKILKRKGNKLNGSFYITMPDNYVKMFEMKEEEPSKEIIRDSNTEIFQMAKAVSKKAEVKRSFSFYGLIMKPFYRSFIKNVNGKDKDFQVEDSCIGCRICEKICPVGNIELIDGKPVWKMNCQQCMGCIQFCPNNAIQIGDKTKERGRYKNPYVTVEKLEEMRI